MMARDPASIVRSIHLPVSYDRPDITRDAIGEAIGAGFGHIVLGLPAPYPTGVVRWVTDELITTSLVPVSKPPSVASGVRVASRKAEEGQLMGLRLLSLL